MFTDFLAPELPERIKPATPVILGVLLIVLMLIAPGGVVGIYRTVRGRAAARRATSTPAPETPDGTAGRR